MKSKKILLIDADSKIPNLALMKLSAYHKAKGNSVQLLKLNIPYYTYRKRKFPYIPPEYDKVYCSVVFDGTLDLMQNKRTIFGGENIIFGGTGFSLNVTLPDNIENLKPDYSIYPDNDISYGFISRGCIRKCYFCKVPEKEGGIHQVNKVSDIVQHKKVKFLDNNFLALSNHKDILKELVDIQIKCQFNQGLDIRLIDKENSELLSKLNYFDKYYFAFDDWKYLKVMERKLPLLSWAKDWELRFFVYCHPDMEFNNIVKRLEFLQNYRNPKLLPYVMRDLTCIKSEYSQFYTSIVYWANNVKIFTTESFIEFMKYKINKVNSIKSRKRYDSFISLYNRNM